MSGGNGINGIRFSRQNTHYMMLYMPFGAGGRIVLRPIVRVAARQDRRMAGRSA